MLSILALASTAMAIPAFLSTTIPQWSLKGPKTGWKSRNLVQRYFHNSELQRQWAWELIGRQSFNGTEHILDFGCGDGKISAMLSRMVPKGSVEGLDMSPDMIEFAQKHFPSSYYPNLNYHCSEIERFKSSEKKLFDYITSFCVFHLIPQPESVLKHLYEKLAPSGKFFLVIPSGENPALFQAAAEGFAQHGKKVPWAEKSNELSICTPEGCQSFLQNAGFQVEHIHSEKNPTVFGDRQELIDWLAGTVTPNWGLDEASADPLLETIVDRMVELDPDTLDSQGSYHFRYSRLHAIATKK